MDIGDIEGGVWCHGAYLYGIVVVKDCDQFSSVYAKSQSETGSAISFVPMLDCQHIRLSIILMSHYYNS